MSSGPSRNRKAVLGACVVVLGLAVAWTRWGGSGSTDGAGADEQSGADDAGVRERYVAEATELGQRRGLIGQSDAWNAALVKVREEWSRAREQLVRAKTVELAEASFRERVLAEVKDMKFLSSRANAVAAPGAVAGGAPGSDAATAVAAMPVRAIALRVEVDTDTPAEVYRLIDRLENLPDVRASVSGVQIVGPGFKQIPWQITATIQVQALALVGEDG